MLIAKNIRRIILIVKVLYYWTLCLLLHPKGRGLDPYKGKTFKRWLTRIMPGSRNSAARLLIYGKVLNVGFNSWLVRDAKINELDCLAINRGKNLLEAVLIGSGAKIEVVIQDAWKGPQKARVEKIRDKWFNKPVAADFHAKSDNTEEQLAWFQETADLVLRTIDYLGPLMEKPNKFEVNGYHNNASELTRAAENRGLFVARFSNVNYIVSSDRALGFQQSQSSRVPTITRSLTDNKQLTKEFLSGYNIPVPEGMLFTELNAAKTYLSTYYNPFVVKPIAGSYGKGITVGVRTGEDLNTAWQYSRKYHEQIILEKMIHGVDLRILVVGGESKAALLRVPAHVIGNGENSIADLIDDKNRERMANPRLCKALIAPDIYVESFLERLGYTLESVPKKGEVVFLHFKANIGAGADSIVITDLIHPDLLRLAEETASLFGVEDFWGIDMLAERIDLPRNKQMCNVIEVNSRANIFNVQFPMYGKPYDVAQVLVDYLFPETITEQPYLVTGIRIIITGLYEKAFFDQVLEQAITLGIKGYIKELANAAEIVASGKKKQLFEFIYKLWDWDGLLSGTVDSLKIEKFNDEIKNTFSIIRDSVVKISLSKKEKGEYSFEKVGIATYDNIDYVQNRSSDLDEQLFVNEFKRLGYIAKPLYEEILEISKPGLNLITGVRFSSLFCDEVCEKLQPARVILSLKGIPVIRGIRFKPNEMKKALKYFDHLNGFCFFNILYKDEVKSFSIKNKKEFIAEWQFAVKKGCKNFIIEEQLEGWNICLAVVSGVAVGALFSKPVEITGDGLSRIADLINEKNALRKQNPVYQNKEINIDRKFTRRLKKIGLQINDILPPGEKVFIESTTGLELGGETISFFDNLHESFKIMASQVVTAIPGLEFAFVHMLVPYPDQPADDQEWAVKKIETRPSVALFHFPWQGVPCNLAQRVVVDLCLKYPYKIGVKLNGQKEI